MNKKKYKTKEELDLVETWDELMKYRRDIIKTSTAKNYNESKDSRYVDELEHYMYTRFPSHDLDITKKVCEQLDLHPPDLQAAHDWFAAARKNQLGKFKYIKI